jgi:signal transduction histidine kinase
MCHFDVTALWRAHVWDTLEFDRQIRSPRAFALRTLREAKHTSRWQCVLFCHVPGNDWSPMSGIDDRYASSNGPREAGPQRLRHQATHFLFGIIGLGLITFAALQLHLQKLPPPSSVGPGTISLLYLIVIVFVSLRVGFRSAAGVSLIAAFFLSYYFLPLLPSLEAKNPLDIVATLAFLITACVISGMVAQVRKVTEAQLALRSQISMRLMEVQEAERRHLARELHDEIGQLLTGLRLLLTLNRDSAAGEIKTRLDEARTLVDDLLARVRRLSFDLRPADLDQLGLLPALLAFFERYTAQTGVLVTFRHQGVDRRFSSQTETGAYRIVQEALTNAARHAGVASVNVRFWVDADKLNIQIEDRGSGFDPDVALKAPLSSGLIGMQERIMLLGGRMTIESSPGSGTTLSAELPLDRAAAA